MEGHAVHELQAVANHLFAHCKDQREAFEECMASKTKNSECTEQYKAVISCAGNLIAEATSKAAHEFKEFAKCMEITGKYSYCREEKNKFEEAFPLEP